MFLPHWAHIAGTFGVGACSRSYHCRNATLSLLHGMEGTAKSVSIPLAWKTYLKRDYTSFPSSCQVGEGFSRGSYNTVRARYFPLLYHHLLIGFVDTVQIKYRLCLAAFLKVGIPGD